MRNLLWTGFQTIILAMFLQLFLWSSAAFSQSTFPIGTSQQQTQEEPPAENPSQALIDILKDDTARAALIAELEAAGSAPAASAQPETVQPEAEPVPQGRHLLESFRAELKEDLSGFWARAKRIPSTLRLAERGFDADILLPAFLDVAQAILVCYGLLIFFRLIMRPVGRRLSRAADGSGWFNRLFLRILATVADIVPVLLAVFLGGLLQIAVQPAEQEFTVAQAAFFSAFPVVELAKVAVRFVLSPGRSNLRVLALPDAGVRSLNRMLRVVISLLGYGQLLIVPVVIDSTSVFVGRAVSTLLATIGLILIAGYVWSKRRSVQDYLVTTYGGGSFSDVVEWIAKRWHWPVMVYLAFILTIVLTRPGNVLLPLLWTSFLVLVAAAVGLLIIGALDAGMSRSIRVPKPVAHRLPLLETRLNSMVPAILFALKVIVIFATLAAIAEIIDVSDVSSFLESSSGSDFVSGLISVLVIAAVVFALYLILASWVDYRLNPFVGEPPTPRLVTLLTLARNAATIALLIFGVMFALSEIGLNIGPLIASAGVLGLAISFGAQKMVEDIITGVFIQFENAMNVGDVVNVGGVIGTVEKLTVRSVTLRDLHGVVHMIPFSSANVISNYMRDFSYYVCDMGVAYREDTETVREAMHDAFAELLEDETQGKFVIGELEWFGLDSFGDSAIVLRARIKTIPGTQWGVKRAYNGIIKRIFDERGIEIPFPHQTLYFGESKDGSAPPVHVAIPQTPTT